MVFRRSRALSKFSLLASWMLLACVLGSYLQEIHAASEPEIRDAFQTKLKNAEKLLAEGRNNDAAKVLETLAVLHPLRAEIYSLWAVALGRVGERLRALRIIDRGLRYSPKNRHLIRARALLA